MQIVAEDGFMFLFYSTFTAAALNPLAVDYLNSRFIGLSNDLRNKSKNSDSRFLNVNIFCYF